MNEQKLQAPEKFDFHAHLARQAAWSLNTFGPGMRTEGVCDHIRKELVEIQADPTDLAEWIDVVILGLDGAWRCGGTPDTIIAGIAAKQTKNEGRTWPDWRTADPTKAIEHVRTGESASTWSSATAPGPDGYQRTVAVPGMPSAARDAVLDEAEQACNSQRGANNGSDWDTAYHYGIAQCVIAIRALKSIAAPAADDNDARRTRHGLHIAKTALGYGWDENGPEGAFEFITRKAYKTGWDDCLERGHAPVQQAAPSGWQSIETAPKDGQYILLGSEDAGGAWVGHYCPVYTSGYRPQNPWASMMLNCDHLQKNRKSNRPTHWMPLPPAPGAAPAQPAGLSEQFQDLADAARAAQRQLRQWMRDHGQDVCTQAAIKAIDAAILAAKAAP